MRQVIERKWFTAWAAGFFDGEGCIQIVLKRSKGSPKKLQELGIFISQKDRRPLALLKERFGGSLFWVHGGVSVLQLGPRAGEVFLRAIYPYSQVKREQIRIALDFRDYQMAHRAHRGLMPAHVYAKREQFRQDLLKVRDNTSPYSHRRCVSGGEQLYD